MDRNEMPIGFSMALAMNLEAMQEFALFSDEKKRQVIAGTHDIRSRDEMRLYVDSLVTNEDYDKTL